MEGFAAQTDLETLNSRKVKPARILIISNGHLCRNPRIVKEATALGEAGHQVTVLTVRNHAPSLRFDAALRESASFAHQQINMLDGPVAWLRRARVRLARDFARSRGPASIHALGPAGALLQAARKLPAELTIVHNEIAHWVGTRLMADGRRVAADFEDWHSEDLLPADRAGRPLGLLRRIEHQLLHQAVYVTTTSHALSATLHTAHGGRRPEVITNSFPLPPLPQRTGIGRQPPALFWFSQTTGPGRGLESFLAAYALVATPARLVLLGEVRGDYDRHLLSLLPESHRNRVNFLPLVPHEELPGLIAQHEVGLALEQSSIRNRDLTITNKILQYLGAGLAVAATPTTGQREVLEHAPHAGIMLDKLADPVATAAQLDDLLRNPTALVARQAAARTLAEEKYCWEREAPRLVSLVRHALMT